MCIGSVSQVLNGGEGTVGVYWCGGVKSEGTVL